MGDSSGILALLIAIVIALALYSAYENCQLDYYLAPQHQKCKHSSPVHTMELPSDGFVGAMAQHPHLVPCAFPTSDSWNMNRCNYA